MEIRIDNLSSLPKAAAEFVAAMRGRRIFLFEGEMGVGKTTFISEVCRQLGVADDEVCSPTFAIVNEYKASQCPIYHFDLYRLDDPREVEDIGIEEYFNSDAVSFIEWPEIGSDFFPPQSVTVTIRQLESGSRIVNIPD